MEADKPETTGDNIQVGDIQDGKAIAIGAGATAVFTPNSPRYHPST